MGTSANPRRGGVSRIECVKQTIIAQMKEMKEKYPDRKVGLVTFTDEVEIIGDGNVPSTTVPWQQMDDYDFMMKNGVACATTQFTKPIKESHDALKAKVNKLTPQGNTALGPGLLTAVALAGEGSLGSQVIVCTDGQSNKGIGYVSGPNTQKAVEFYERLGQYAKGKGVTVHIVTIIGQECNIDAISPVAEATNGEIERVDPLDIQKNIGDFLSREVLATKVELKVKLHKGLEFRNEQPQNVSEDKTILSKDFGNVTADTDVTFEYQLKSVKELLKLKDIDITQIKAFPFQAQIYYTALDGSR